MRVRLLTSATYLAFSRISSKPSLLHEPVDSVCMRGTACFVIDVTLYTLQSPNRRTHFQLSTGNKIER